MLMYVLDSVANRHDEQLRYVPHHIISVSLSINQIPVTEYITDSRHLHQVEHVIHKEDEVTQISELIELNSNITRITALYFFWFHCDICRRHEFKLVDFHVAVEVLYTHFIQPLCYLTIR